MTHPSRPDEVSAMRLLSCVLLLAGAAATAAADDFKPEPGFELLLNGKDLTGWKTKGSKDRPGGALDGKTEVFGGRFRVADGELVIDPKVKGDVRIETAKAFGKDTVIRFEFKGGPGCNNDLFLLGTKFDIRTDAKGGLKGLKENDWNEAELAVSGGQAVFKVNGTTAGTQKTKGEKSPFEIRAEFGPIQIRKLRAKTGG